MCKMNDLFAICCRCDGCKCTGRKLEESFMWRGEMKRVCNQHCLLLFYTQQNIPNMNTQTQSTIPAIQLTQVAPSKYSPVTTQAITSVPIVALIGGHPAIGRSAAGTRMDNLLMPGTLTPTDYICLFKI